MDFGLRPPSGPKMCKPAGGCACACAQDECTLRRLPANVALGSAFNSCFFCFFSSSAFKLWMAIPHKKMFPLFNSGPDRSPLANIFFGEVETTVTFVDTQLQEPGRPSRSGKNERGFVTHSRDSNFKKATVLKRGHSEGAWK